MCLITILIVILTLYDVNLTLVNVYDASEKKLSARSGFEPENHKHEACHATSSTIWVARCDAMGFVKRKLCIIVAVDSMTSLRGRRVFVICRDVPGTNFLPGTEYRVLRRFFTGSGYRVFN